MRTNPSMRRLLTLSRSQKKTLRLWKKRASNWSELCDAATELEAAYQTLGEDLVSDTATARDTYDGVIGELGASLSEADAQYHGHLLRVQRYLLRDPWGPE